MAIGAAVAGVDPAERFRLDLPDSAAEHQAIYDAVVAGDLDAVAHATEVRIANGYAALHQHLTGHAGPDPLNLSVD